MQGIVVQKRGNGEGLAPGWALQQEMCPLGEEDSSVPIGAASLRGGSKWGRDNLWMWMSSSQVFDPCSRMCNFVEGVFGMMERAASDASSVV